MPPVPTHTRRWFRFGHQMAVARIVICVVGIALPYAARIPGAIAYGPDWFNSYLPSSWSAFLLIGKFNAICWGSVLLATLTYRNALSVLFPAAFGFAFAFWGNAMLDLASDAQAAIAIIFIPIYALPFVCVGWAIGFVFDRQKGRRKFQFGLGAMLVAVTVFAVLLGWLTRPSPFPGAFPDPRRKIDEVEMSLASSGSGSLWLRFSDPGIIQPMVVEPFRQSQLDPHPAADIYVGTLIIVYDDGSTDTAMMFAPWGHFKFDGAYGVANVSRFRDECRKSLLQSSHPDASRLLNDPRLWK